MRQTEYINKENLEKLLSIDIKELLLEAGKSKDNETWSYTHISKGIKSLKSVNSVKYKFGKNYKHGRQYSIKISLQSIPNSFRGYLTEGTGYKDYDMVNCSFNILKKLCNVNNIPCLYITEYTEKREEILRRENLTKQFMITFLLSDKPKLYNKDYLTNFYNELNAIKDKLVSIYLDKINDFDNKKNPISSQLCQIIHYYENEILTTVINSYKLKDAVLIFDGFMSRKDISTEELKAVSGGYDWVIKPFEELDIEDEIEDEYKIQKHLMEENNFISLEPFQRWSRINLNYDYEPQSKIDFEDKNAIFNYIDQKGETIPIMKKWMTDSTRRTYHQTVFNPDPDFNNVNIFNLFKPFDIIKYIKIYPKPDKCIQNFKDLVYNLSGRNEENNKYLTGWLAHTFQKPHINPQTCVVLKGKQGNGKDTLTNIMEKLFGTRNEYLKKISDINHITGTFNECLDQKLMVQINEMSGKDGVAFNNRIKDLITTEYNLINKKYKNLQVQVNYIRWLIYSNNISPIVVEATCRRFVIFQTEDDNLGNRDYFGKIYNDIKDKEWLLCVYKYLIQYDLTEFNPDIIPQNKDKISLMRNNINPIHNFMKQEFDKIKFVDIKITGKDYKCILPFDLFEEYESFENYRNYDKAYFYKVIKDLKGSYEKRVKLPSTNKLTSKNWFAFDEVKLMKDLNYLVKDLEEEEGEIISQEDKESQEDEYIIRQNHKDSDNDSVASYNSQLDQDVDLDEF